MRIAATLTIGRLKPLVERLLRVKLAHQTLLLRDPTGTVVEDVTQQDGKELRFYEIEDGWHVEVGKRDSAAVAAAKARRSIRRSRGSSERCLSNPPLPRLFPSQLSKVARLDGSPCAEIEIKRNKSLSGGGERGAHFLAC